ncbi:MAG: hypothetical protein Fur009_3650 [Candidatus Microgenomates bacterium]
MKKQINLLTNREDYQKYEELFLYFRKSTYIFLIFFFIILIYFLITISNQNKKINLLNLEKTSLLKTINLNAEKYAKLNYLNKKYIDLENFLKNDANSSFYYSILNNSLKDSSEAALIKNFVIDKDRKFEVTIAFNDFSSLRNFFQFIENEKFLKYFEKIFLKNFTIIGTTLDKKENYELSFYGIFLPYKKFNQ